MVTYYLTEIATGDAKIAGKGIYECVGKNKDFAWRKAMASYHKKMGTAMDSDMYESELIYITDVDGVQLYCDKYNKPEDVQEETEE